MNIEYTEKIFINPAIEYGIDAYIKNKNGEKYNRAHTFEMYIIKALVAIYGEKTILLPYRIDNEKAFECNLLMYDLKEIDMKNFLNYINLYHSMMREFNSDKKVSGLVNEIEKILLQMINKRSKRKPFTEEELKEFDNIFNPIDNDLRRLKKLIGSEDGLINKEWQRNKNELSNTQLRMMAVNPKLLLPNEYSRFGYDLNYVATLSEEEIENINKKITEEMIRNDVNTKQHKVSKRNKLVLSCGSGFVDKLLLLSIMATEIMIGIIITVSIGG